MAALTAAHWDVEIVDENIEPLPLDLEADIIGIGGMGVQAPRQKQLIAAYRALGAAPIRQTPASNAYFNMEFPSAARCDLRPEK